MYRFLFTGFMIANVSSVFYIPKERTPQQNCRNIITQYMESLMMLRQEYPSSVLHHAWKKVYSCLYIHLFHNRPRAQYYTAALRTVTHLPAPATLPSYMIQMSGNLRISAPVLSKVVSAAELYTEPVMKIWRGFQEATRSSDCGVACLSTDRCEFCISSNP